MGYALKRPIISEYIFNNKAMTGNYYLEYRYIPSLIERFKKTGAPFGLFSDISQWKKEFEHNGLEINWDELSVEIIDELGIAENPSKGTGRIIGHYYVVYTFPTIEMPPEAKYGVIHYNPWDGTINYYTLESDMDEGWYICSQDVKEHRNLGQCKEMTKVEFVEYIKQSNFSSKRKHEIILFLVILIIFLVLYLIKLQ